jgi:hypothetical protein
MAIPTSAKEQLRQALELGHEPSVVKRVRKDFPDAPPKYWLKCSCGYESTARRSEKALAGVLIWHMGKALGEADALETEMRRNGATLRENPAS